MSCRLILYSAIILISTFIGAVSQVLLKKSALQSYSSRTREYLNPFVVVSYALFLFTTVLSVIAYRVVPLSYGPVLEASSYLYITAFGFFIFGEKITAKKLAALALIVAGIVIYSFGV